MKTLIGVAGCHRPEYLAKAHAQRMTWVRDVVGADVRFFCGHPINNRTKQPDEVWLDCPDNWQQRKLKIIAMVQWALNNGYDRMFKVDDDVYLRPERLSSLGEVDYGGFVVNWPYKLLGVICAEQLVCCGPFYVLSKTAMGVLTLLDIRPKFPIEDDWVAAQLVAYGIEPTQLMQRLGTL